MQKAKVITRVRPVTIGACSVCKEFIITDGQRYHEFKDIKCTRLQEVCYKCFKRK